MLHEVQRSEEKGESEMNVSLLKNKLKAKGMSVEEFAEKFGVDRSTMYRKMNLEVNITIAEANRVKTILELTDEEAKSIFFG